ncbi:SulP family inorganic anion transporter [Salinactinospora qingdaonensis]|uniref:carbonic anhydrase n=1 Tax=Salinactinospora qingdaonensis TaxID=702744 RepID=A0ABP7EYU2_9ACTN
MVFLVAVPLSLGIAVASGAPLIAGLISAAVGGIVVGALGGSAVQVSGPAAGLTIVVAEIIHTYGWPVACLITMLAGVVQIALGAFRVARAALAISPAVTHGMLAGIGVTIALAQLHVVLGGDPQSSPVANLAELPHQLAHNHTPAVVVGVVTIGCMLVWSRLPDIGRLRPRQVPSALVAVGVATALAGFMGWPVERVNLPESMADAWSGPALPHPDQAQGVVVSVATLALVASVASLLSGIAVDRMHDGRRIRLNRELIGQGAANATSGALGGLPVAGVIVRSTANARAGGRTPLSAILHGVWVILLVALFTPLVEHIPMAALAGLLVLIGVQMVNLAQLRDLRKHHEVSVYLVTMTGVLLLGLMEGVLVGLALAVLVSLRRLTRMSVLTEERDGRWHIVVQGSLTFLGVPRVTDVLRSIPAGAQVDLDLHVDFMDHAAFESIHAWRVDHERSGGQVDIDEVHENWYERSTKLDAPAAKTLLPRGLARSWARRRSHDDTGPVSGLLLAGAREYHASTTERMRTTMRRLAHCQQPKVLFISCADSRLVPNVITASGPGDLFTVRNIGNLVPPYQPNSDDSVGAAIEYAVTVLEVPSIVVCGHSHCTAMQALLEGTSQDTGDAEVGQLARWLHHAGPDRAFQPASENVPSAEAVGQMSQANVVRQLENLLSYPVVRRRFEAGTLELTGMYFDLETSRVQILDEQAQRFVPVPEEVLSAPESDSQAHKGVGVTGTAEESEAAVKRAEPTH